MVYGGTGYEGGYWQGGHLYYNRTVNNISNVQITNVYNKTVINNVTVNRVSYNGANGIHAQPNAAQLAATRDRHIALTTAQQQHFETARNDSSQHVSQNSGHPPVAATSRAGAFTGAGVVSARGSGALSVVHASPSRPSPTGTTSAAGNRSMGERPQSDPTRNRAARSRTACSTTASTTACSRAARAGSARRASSPGSTGAPCCSTGAGASSRGAAATPRHMRLSMKGTMNTIEHDPIEHRFSIVIDGLTAVLDYTLSNGVMTITHTSVPAPIGGRGIAAELMRGSFERRANGRMDGKSGVLLCGGIHA